MTPDEFEKLSPEKKAAAIEHHNEHVREWRARCARCGAELRGTLSKIREHSCVDPR